MISKNNSNEKMTKVADRRDRFAIRKLTIGAVSVVLGTTLWLGTDNQVAHADTNDKTQGNPDVVSKSEQAVNTQKVDHVVVETNSVQNKDVQTEGAQTKAPVAKSDAKIETEKKSATDAKKAPVINDSAQPVKATDSEIQARVSDTPKVNTPVQTETKSAENKTQSENQKTSTQSAVSNQTVQKDKTTTDEKQEHTITVTNIDDVTGQTLYGSGSFKAKTGDKSHQIYTGYVGYKLMNPEVLKDYQVTSPAYGHANLVVPDHDVDLTLHFAPLAPTTIEYVDTEGNILTKFSDSSKASTSKSLYSEQDGIEDSKILARAIDIPGYELVSAPTIEKPITQVSTKDNLNPMVLKFVYKKIAENAEQGLPNGGGAGITGLGKDYGINWNNLPGGVNIDLVKETYGDNNFENTIKNMDERYTKQGFSYLGVLNDHKDSDKTNRLESYVSVHFLSHKPVKVNYVDQDGKKLADSVEISFNKANPDQTNNGIDPQKNWYPNGEWKSEQKSFEGYKLKTVEGATQGKFTTFNYNVTYVYTNQADGNVLYIDDTDQKTLKEAKLNGKIGATIDYSTASSIADYEKQGYVLVSDDFSNGKKIFDPDTAKNKFEVHFKHGVKTQTTSQPATETIHYVYEDGKKAADDHVQKTDFVKTIKTDAVTGKVINDNWQPESYTFEQVVSPTIENYHPDQKTVNGATVTPDKSTVEVTVTYVKNENELRNQDSKKSTQTVKFVDEAGHEIAKAVVSPVFTYQYSGDTYDKYTGKELSKGDWNATSHQFDTVNVPVIDGYVVVDGFKKESSRILAGGLTSTLDNLNVVAQVVYQKVGKIVPVDPNGKEIPNVPTPVYPNDPKDPTKVVPDEPVPTIPGYVPGQNTVTPADPGKDTPVPYSPEVAPKDQVAVVNYIDADENNHLLSTSGNLTGKAGNKIDYSTKSTINNLENKGYVLVNDGFPEGASFDNDDSTVQTYTVIFKHGTATITPDKPGQPGQPINPNDPDGPKWPNNTGKDGLIKTGKQTIHYVGASDKTPADNVQEFTFTKKMTVDKVTGKVIDNGSWNVTSHTFGKVDTPVVEGFHADKRTAGGQTITPEDLTKVVTVTYVPNGRVIPVDPNGKEIPNVPTPVYPTDPTDATKVVPDEPVPTIPGYVPGQNTVTPADPGKDTPVPYSPEVAPKDQVAVVNYIDADENNHLLSTSGNLTGKAESKIDYSTKSTINNLENKGYVLVNDGFPEGASFDNDDSTVQTYTVIFKHGTATITPDKPGQPGQPINPNDPDGPKWPDNTGKDGLIKTGKQTIHYTGAGKDTPQDNVQEFTFTKKMAVDKVTGKVIDNGSWNVTSHTFGKVETPVVEGFHADKRIAGGETITPEDLTKVVTVTYVPNGRIIPVDPNGKEIPNVPTPVYPTDPTDATKVVPDEPVPTIPGYVPGQNTVTPADPGKDTPVPYSPKVAPKDQVAIVNYIDADENNHLLSTSGNLTGKAGNKIDYSTKSTINNLENKGYVLVNDGFPEGASFDNDDSTVQTYTVIFKHGTATITPDKPGQPGQPINPNDPDGPKWPEGTDQDSLTKTGKQTIHYTGAGKDTPQDNVQEFAFTKKMVIDRVTGKVIDNGSWNVTSHTFGKVDTPVVEGFHADKRIAGSETITPEDLTKVVTVTYVPNGKIIPVDPNGKEIPNVPTPVYPTDPIDATKVVPDEPVPTIPGYVPSQNTVTPVDPGKDTPVPYNPEVAPKNQVAIVNYIDADENNHLLSTSGNLTGKAGNKIDYSTKSTINNLENKGYVLVNDGFPEGASFDNDDSTVQTYTVIFKHGTATITPDKPGQPGQPINPNDPDGPKWPDNTGKDGLIKTGKQTIHYVGASDKTPADNVQEFTFTKKMTVDKVTGKVIDNGSWNVTSHTFGKVDTPVVEGFHADKRIAGSETITPEDLTKVVTVTYVPNGKIIPVDPSGKEIPNVPTPVYPTDPTDATKVVPDEPVPTIPNMTPNQSTVTPANPDKDTPVVYTEPEDKTATGKVTYIDDTTGKNIEVDQLKGKFGQTITYTTKNKVAGFENKGYKLVSNNFREGKETFGKNNDFEVHLEHDLVPVNPSNPGKPGQSINPNDPDGPKWPEGTDQDSLTKIGKQTIHYVGADQTTPKDNVTTTKFNHEVVVDKVTGKIVKDNGWTPNNYTFSKIDTPKIDGYHADKDVAGGKQVSVENPEVVDTVTYTKNEVPTPQPTPDVPVPHTQTVPDTPTNPEPTPAKPASPTDNPVKPAEDKPEVFETVRPLSQKEDPIPTKAKKSPDKHVIGTDIQNPKKQIQTVKPHATKVNGRSGIVTVKHNSVEKKLAIANKQAIKSTTKKEVAKTLPQTGQSNNEAATVIGGLVAGISLIGLSGVKKRKEEK